MLIFIQERGSVKLRISNQSFKSPRALYELRDLVIPLVIDISLLLRDTVVIASS